MKGKKHNAFESEKRRMVEVVAALIRNNGKFMICRRPEYKARGNLWEFAGGKVEKGETKQQALIRECRKEMDIIVDVGSEFMSVVHNYPDITVHLSIYNAVIVSGSPKLTEHSAIAWIAPEDIPDYEFCPADKSILEKLSKEGNSYE